MKIVVVSQKKNLAITNQQQYNFAIKFHSLLSFERKKKKGTSERNSGVWEERILNGYFFS
jgi:hypothetical protein